MGWRNLAIVRARWETDGSLTIRCVSEFDLGYKPGCHDWVHFPTISEEDGRMFIENPFVGMKATIPLLCFLTGVLVRKPVTFVQPKRRFDSIFEGAGRWPRARMKREAVTFARALCYECGIPPSIVTSHHVADALTLTCSFFSLCDGGTSVPHGPNPYIARAVACAIGHRNTKAKSRKRITVSKR